MSGDLVPHFPNHIRQTARSLSLAGYSSEQIARQIETLYPGEGPTGRTIANWRSTFPKLSDEEAEAISQKNREIALTAQRIQLERLTEHPNDIPFRDIVIAGGVAQDKELTRLQRVTPSQASTFIPVQIIIQSPPPNEHT